MTEVEEMIVGSLAVCQFVLKLGLMRLRQREVNFRAPAEKVTLVSIKKKNASLI